MSTNLYDPDAELERLYLCHHRPPRVQLRPRVRPVYNSYAQSYRRAAASPCATRWVRPPP